MQNKIRATEDVERKKYESKAGIIHIIIGHGFLWTHFHVVNALIKT